MIPHNEYNIRRQQIKAHIKLLEQRYSESERQESVAALRERLQRLKSELRPA